MFTATVNIYVQVFLWAKIFYLLWINTKKHSSCIHGKCVQFYKKLPKHLPRQLFHFTLPLTMKKSSTSSPTFLFVNLLDLVHSSRCVVASHCCFNLHFLDNIRYGTSLYMLICPLHVFFGELSVNFFSPLLNSVVCIFIVEF